MNEQKKSSDEVAESEPKKSQKLYFDYVVSREYAKFIRRNGMEYIQFLTRKAYSLIGNVFGGRYDDIETDATLIGIGPGVQMITETARLLHDNLHKIPAFIFGKIVLCMPLNISFKFLDVYNALTI